MNAPIDLAAKLALFSDLWSPRVVAQMNDVRFKLVRLQGEFVWHRHDDTDEAFLVLEGRLVIQTRGEDIVLEKGQMVVIPKGMEHRPVAEEECHVMLVEPAGVLNTGDVDTDRTAPNDVWI